jgi:6-phosphofructokinase
MGLSGETGVTLGNSAPSRVGRATIRARERGAAVRGPGRDLSPDGLAGLVVIGGDGTFGLAHRFTLLGLPIVGFPNTIDNGIVGTTNCFGFDAATTRCR